VAAYIRGRKVKRVKEYRDGIPAVPVKIEFEFEDDGTREIVSFEDYYRLVEIR
jgi:hypothetical protein